MRAAGEKGGIRFFFDRNQSNKPAYEIAGSPRRQRRRRVISGGARNAEPGYATSTVAPTSAAPSVIVPVLDRTGISNAPHTAPHVGPPTRFNKALIYENRMGIRLRPRV